MMRQVRLLQLVTRDEQGGVQILTRMVEAGLSAHGVAVTTLALDGGGNPARRLLHLLAVMGRLALGRYDAVFAYQAAASILGCGLGWIVRVPLRAAHQTAMPCAVRPHWRRLDRLWGRAGLHTHIVANSTATRQAFSGYPYAYRYRIVQIPHGVDPLPPADGQCDWRTALSIPSRAPLLLATGRLAPQKNHATAIAALACLPDAHLVIAGDGPDRPMLLQEALRLGVAGRLHLVGGLDRARLGNLMAAADIYLFPSVWETFGLAGVEAGMAGLPIVAADLPVLREVLAPGLQYATVRFHPACDAEALAAAVNAILIECSCRERCAGSARAFLAHHGTAPMIAGYRALLGSI